MILSRSLVRFAIMEDTERNAHFFAEGPSYCSFDLDAERVPQ